MPLDRNCAKGLMEGCLYHYGRRVFGREGAPCIAISEAPRMVLLTARHRGQNSGV